MTKKATPSPRLDLTEEDWQRARQFWNAFQAEDPYLKETLPKLGDTVLDVLDRGYQGLIAGFLRQTEALRDTYNTLNHAEDKVADAHMRKKGVESTKHAQSIYKALLLRLPESEPGKAQETANTLLGKCIRCAVDSFAQLVPHPRRSSVPINKEKMVKLMEETMRNTTDAERQTVKERDESFLHRTARRNPRGSSEGRS